jgi:hypothetical protein
MANYVIEIPEKTLMGKHLISFLKSLSLSVMPVKSYLLQAKSSTNGFDADYSAETVRLTEKELKQVEKSLKSGFSTMEELKEILSR